MTACDPSDGIYNRISGRVCNPIRLDVTFYKNGIHTDPYAIRAVRIYRKSVDPANLVLEIPFVDPTDSSYPSPALTETGKPGYYELIFDVPKLDVPDMYIDQWLFVCNEPAGTGGTGDACDGNFDIDDENHWDSVCNQFWLYPDGWFADSGLKTPRLGFEPLDTKFVAGDVRPLEVGMMPLPLYDYDYNLITPMLPYMCATITIKTRNCEVLVDEAPMEIGLRQGSYRSNPFVLKYMIDTSMLLIGTYEYNIKVRMPNGHVISSPKFTFTVSQ